jgi:hypothetical protein
VPSSVRAVSADGSPSRVVPDAGRESRSVHVEIWHPHFGRSNVIRGNGRTFADPDLTSILSDMTTAAVETSRRTIRRSIRDRAHTLTNPKSGQRCETMPKKEKAKPRQIEVRSA